MHEVLTWHAKSCPCMQKVGSIAQVPSNRFCTVQSTFNRPIESLTVQSNFLPSNQFFNRPNKLGLGLDPGLRPNSKHIELDFLFFDE